jgi:hypothetical protein
MTPCGAKTRSGGQCGRPAGWGTNHPGIGRCKPMNSLGASARPHAPRAEAW